MKRSLLMVCFMMLVSSSGFAADGSNGCGPGWYVLKKNSLLSSFGRYITHGVLFPSVTLGMTFGTSNCAKHSIVLKDQRSLHFANQNMEHLKHDIAKGEGEFLQAYLASFGCSVFAQKPLRHDLQDYFGDLFAQGTSPQPMELVALTGQLIIEAPGVAELCGADLG